MMKSTVPNLTQMLCGTIRRCEIVLQLPHNFDDVVVVKPLRILLSSDAHDWDIHIAASCVNAMVQGSRTNIVELANRTCPVEAAEQVSAAERELYTKLQVYSNEMADFV